MPAAFAASLAVIASTWLIVRQQEPGPAAPRTLSPPVPASRTAPVVLNDGPYSIRITGAGVEAAYGRDDWNALARDAIRRQRIDVARRGALEPAIEPVRGSASAGTAALLDPVGTVVASQRPTLRWKGPAGAEYVVAIARQDGTVVATSRRLRGTSWTAPVLPRGVTYLWQLTIHQPGGTTDTAPRPPAPPALFAVLDAEPAREIETAPHLIKALLYAKYGVRTEAAEELEAFSAENHDAPIAKKLALSLQRGAPTRTNADQ